MSEGELRKLFVNTRSGADAQAEMRAMNNTTNSRLRYLETLKADWGSEINGQAPMTVA